MHLIKTHIILPREAGFLVSKFGQRRTNTTTNIKGYKKVSLVGIQSSVLSCTSCSCAAPTITYNLTVNVLVFKIINEAIIMSVSVLTFVSVI